jgi:hypothetical protein
MQVVVSYPDRPKVVADTLSVGADYIWLRAPGSVDEFGIFLRDEDWVTGSGKAVRVEAILLGDGDQGRSVAPSGHVTWCETEPAPQYLTHLV